MSLHTITDREGFGVAERERVPPGAHAAWDPSTDRADPIAILEDQNRTRVDWLVPVRHARMRVSPFTFYRGTAAIMAGDLATAPRTGLDVQLVGDGHLSNFGAYASPERRLVFDVNDFDETLRGPFEWDVKRLAASFMIAARHRGLGKSVARAVTADLVSSYRSAMVHFGSMGFLALWYEHTGVADLRKLPIEHPNRLRKALRDFEERAKRQDSLRALTKLTEQVDGRFRIRTDHPVLVPIREVLPEWGPHEIEQGVSQTFADYRRSLRDDRRLLIERYELVDIALKVVGVGSVGTRCFVLLLQGKDEHDPLFLQAKEATGSVLEHHLEPSQYPHHGQRVVQGQRQIQAQSDICLGWATGPLGVHYYIRQLRDWKGSYDVETATEVGLRFYASVCGHVLARGHARSGDPVAIAAYMGDTDEFDRALVAFSETYAAQTTEDFDAFNEAIESGRLPVQIDG